MSNAGAPCEVAGIIGIPGRLQSVQAAAFAWNPRPTSSECAVYETGCRPVHMDDPAC